MQKLVLENLNCASCANKIENALCKMPNVQHATINFNTSTLYVQADDLESVKSKIVEIEPHIGFVDQFSKTRDSISSKKEIVLLSSLLIAFGFGMLMLHYEPLQSTLSHATKIAVYVVLIGVYCVAGMPIFKAVINNINNKVLFDENFLMFIATIAALCIGEISEAVAVMIFFRIGEFLESSAVKKSKKSLYSLLDITPEIAHVKSKDINNNETIWHDTHPDLLNIDDIVLVKAGEKIPTDGVILHGKSHLNMQSLSGESKPVFVQNNDHVLAGAINIESVLQIQVSKKFQDSQISKIKATMEEASSTKAKTQKLITRFAQVYTPIVFVLALAIAIIPPIFSDGYWHEWIYRALVVLMVSCPCALVLSVPLGYFGVIGVASKNGILVKGSQHFETLASLKNIVFDKTGTLTQGVFKIIDIIPLNNSVKDELLKTAIHAQRFSNHPIAKSIMQESKDINYTCQAQEFREISGKGIFAKCCNEDILVGNESLMKEFNIDISSFYTHSINQEMIQANSIVHVAKNGNYMGYIIMGDSIKEDSKEAINIIKKLGITPLAILSGDNEKSVAFVANELGIKEYYANLLPTQKVEKMQELMNLHKGNSDKMAFVGDGINDCVVLSYADVGISITAKDSNNDLSKESADIVLTTPSLMGVVNAIKISKRIQRVTWENIAFVLGTKIVLIILGILGIANMWIAVFGDVGVALLALLHALPVVDKAKK